MMKKLIVALAFCACASAFAQSAPLYEALGGKPGIAALVDDFVKRLVDDRRMQPFFRDAEQPKLQEGLVAQFCEVSGGPCRREGKDMRTVHDGQDITRADFNALVEVLQRSMDARGIPFATQNRLLALLAPMHRDIVNKP